MREPVIVVLNLGLIVAVVLVGIFRFRPRRIEDAPASFTSLAGGDGAMPLDDGGAHCGDGGACHGGH
jgi:hypothetical protein